MSVRMRVINEHLFRRVYTKLGAWGFVQVATTLALFNRAIGFPHDFHKVTYPSESVYVWVSILCVRCRVSVRAGLAGGKIPEYPEYLAALK